MRVFKKGLAMILALAMVATAFYPLFQQAMAAEFILEPTALSGQDYTASDPLAAALDEIFAGDIGIYSDTQLTQTVTMPVGTFMDNDMLYYVKSQTTGNSVAGWQCYIYGNAVYNKLFREWVGHANGFSHSQVVIPGGGNSVSYEAFLDAGVRCGAYLRTTGNADGSYSSNVGHSMIILAYDSENITYLEGNGDGYGLIRVAIRDWNDFNLRQLSGRGRYIAHVVQPTDEYYDEQYPACKHEAYEGCGVCTACGTVYDWQSTLDPWAQGIYRVTRKVTPREDAPYHAATASSVTLLREQQILTTGQYRNAFDQVWYSAKDEEGNTFYINGAYLKFVEHPKLEVTCTGFSPEDGAQLEQKSYPVKGAVTANFPIKSISGYLDGTLFATWTPENQSTTQVELRQTDINQKLSFSKLEGGKHTITLVAEGFIYGQNVTFHESSFYTISKDPCSHDYVGTVTRDATCVEDGMLTYTCQKCFDAYVRTIVAPGHDYQDYVCSYCGEEMVLCELSGIVLTGSPAEDAPVVTLTQDGTEVYSTQVVDGAYLFEGVRPGTYLFTVTRSGCVPWTTELTFEPGAAVIDVRLCVYGDVNADLKLNIGDLSRLYAHVRGSGLLEDEYNLLCADYNADGSLNIGDAVKLYGFLRQGGS